MDQPAEPDDATRSRAPAIVATERRASVAKTIEPGDLVDEDPERYSIEGHIGIGGMGTVLAAKSTRFGRAVALKVVTADRDDLRRRFTREAQVTARLQHPAIVPVYGSGRGRDGHPFYAMKQVTGEPLDKAIRKATTPAQRLALLPKVIAVTEAIAYAHSERVIHRDLKPANILVGAFGETVVIDWGLAKDLANDETDEVAAAHPYRSAADETAFGKVMGTPAYMPLEQARGERVSERADVYALGAILYHVLSGSPPFVRVEDEGVPWETMLARVLSGPPAPLPSVAADIAPDLRAIVSRAMARRPEDRYPTAGELAEDLRRFQTGQLVGAHRYSTWQLIRRWIRRHRTPVLVAAISLVVLAVVAVVSVQRIIREEAEAEAARALAERHRADAEELTSFMLYDMRDKLERVGRVDLLAAVASRVAAHYEALPETSDPLERSKRATTFENLGDVFLAQGNVSGALDKYQHASAVLLDLERTDHAPQGQYVLAHLEAKLGTTRSTLGSYTEAETMLRRAQARLESILELEPAKFAWGRELLEITFGLADVLAHRGDHAASRAAADRGLAIARRLRALDPNDRARKWEEAYALSRHTDAILKADPDASLAELRTAKTLMLEVIAADPKDAIKPSALLRDLHRRIGVVLQAQHKHLQSIESYRAAVAISEARSVEDPTNTEHPVAIAGSRAMIAQAMLGHGDVAAALVELEKALAIYETLLIKDPANRNWQRDAMTVLANLADTKRASNDLAGAMAHYRRALVLGDHLVAGDANNVEDQLGLAMVHVAIGDTYAIKGDRANALAEHRTARQIRQALASKDPSDPDRQHALWVSDVDLGDLLKKYKDPVAAEQAYERALATLRPLIATFPTNASLQRELMGTLQRRIDVLLVNHKATEGLASAREVVAWFQARLREHPDDDSARADAASVGQTLGDALVATGDRAAGIAEYRAALVTIDALLAKNPAVPGYLTDRTDLRRKLATP